MKKHVDSRNTGRSLGQSSVSKASKRNRILSKNQQRIEGITQGNMDFHEVKNRNCIWIALQIESCPNSLILSVCLSWLADFLVEW